MSCKNVYYKYRHPLRITITKTCIKVYLIYFNFIYYTFKPTENRILNWKQKSRVWLVFSF